MLKIVIVVMSTVDGTPTCHGVFENVQDALRVARVVWSPVIELAEIDV